MLTRFALDNRTFVLALMILCVIAGPVSPETAFKLGEKANDPVTMYLQDIYTIAVNLAGLPGLLHRADRGEVRMLVETLQIGLSGRYEIAVFDRAGNQCEPPWLVTCEEAGKSVFVVRALINGIHHPGFPVTAHVVLDCRQEIGDVVGLTGSSTHRDQRRGVVGIEADSHNHAAVFLPRLFQIRSCPSVLPGADQRQPDIGTVCGGALVVGENRLHGGRRSSWLSQQPQQVRVVVSPKG